MIDADFADPYADFIIYILKRKLKKGFSFSYIGIE